MTLEKMPKEEPPNQYVDFWQMRYDANEMPWDLNAPAPYLETVPGNYPPGKMAVPGCGRGHDAALFARNGFDVTGFDFAPGAIAAATSLYGDIANWQQADWFYPDEKYNGVFDYVLEHTCYCAINPTRRGDYLQTAHRILKPGGVLMGIFWDMDEPDGPPFGTTLDELKAAIKGYFQLVSTEEIPAKLRRRESGREYFAVMRALPL